MWSDATCTWNGSSATAALPHCHHDGPSFAFTRFFCLTVAYIYLVTEQARFTTTVERGNPLQLTMNQPEGPECNLMTTTPDVVGCVSPLRKMRKTLFQIKTTFEHPSLSSPCRTISKDLGIGFSWTRTSDLWARGIGDTRTPSWHGERSQTELIEVKMTQLELTD
jgi:hypothetical protein